MRHNVYGKHLGRDKNQRTALFRGLIRSLVLQGSIVSTDAKIKAVKGLIDKLFVKAKKGDQASRNVLTRTIPQKDVTDKIMELVKNFKNRNSGFTETVRLGVRAGDGTMMMRMSLIDQSSVVSQSETEELKTEKLASRSEPKPENRKQKTDNKKQKEKR